MNKEITTQDKEFIDGMRKLSPDNFAIVVQLIKIMTECKGDINKEVEMMRKADFPDWIISAHRDIFFKQAENKKSAVEAIQ